MLRCDDAQRPWTRSGPPADSRTQCAAPAPGAHDCLREARPAPPSLPDRCVTPRGRFGASPKAAAAFRPSAETSARSFGCSCRFDRNPTNVLRLHCGAFTFSRDPPGSRGVGPSTASAQLPPLPPARSPFRASRLRKTMPWSSPRSARIWTYDPAGAPDQSRTAERRRSGVWSAPRDVLRDLAPARTPEWGLRDPRRPRTLLPSSYTTTGRQLIREGSDERRR